MPPLEGTLPAAMQCFTGEEHQLGRATGSVGVAGYGGTGTGLGSGAAVVCAAVATELGNAVSCGGATPIVGLAAGGV